MIGRGMTRHHRASSRASHAVSLSAGARIALLVALAACAPDRLTHVDGAATAATAAPTATVVGATTSADGSSEPHFLETAEGAPTIANPVISFWAKKGVKKEVQMVYHRESGGRDSIPFFSLRLRERSLWRRPDGTTIANGDSVLITLTLVDAERGIVDCQPSGLRFADGDPARVKISFHHDDDDLNHDGVVNGTDAAITKTLQIWRKESVSEPWLSMKSRVADGPDEVEADINGFTGYAIAW